LQNKSPMDIDLIEEVDDMDAVLTTPEKGEDLKRLEEITREMLGLLGEDVQREGLQKTPRRVADSLKTLTSGYKQDVKERLHGLQNLLRNRCCGVIVKIDTIHSK